MADTKQEPTETTPKDARPPRTPEQEAELVALKARVAELESMTPPPFEEFPKWVESPDGQKVIVPDAETEKAVLAGKKDVVPTFPTGATPVFQPEVPSVKGDDEPEAAKSSTKKK